MKRFALALLVSLMLVGVGCGDDVTPPASDAGLDAGADAAPVDAGSCLATAADYPAPVTGACEANVALPGAALPVGDDGAGGFIVPGGRRVTRVGRQVRLPGFPSSVLPIPGTRFAVVSDGGRDDELLRVIDVESLAIVDSRTFHTGDSSSEALFLGLAVSADGRRLWASGGGSNRIFAYDVDLATGALTEAPARSITLADAAPTSGHFAGIALTPDGTTLVAPMLLVGAVGIYDAETGAELRRVVLDPDAYPYDVAISADGTRAYVSEIALGAVVPIEVATGTVGTPMLVGAAPQGLALSPDGTKLVVAAANSDQLSIIDVALGAVTSQIDVHGAGAPRGASPVSVSFDASGRLYAVNAGDSAVAVFEPSGESYHSLGRLPTMWYPSDAAPLPDGRLLVLSAKHESTGPNLDPSVGIVERTGGSLAVVDAADLTPAQLAVYETEVASNIARPSTLVNVSCPSGAPYDFPVPLPGTGPSTKLEHVIIIVRENKTYDAYFGAYHDDAGAPLGNGDPALTLIPAADIDRALPNTFALARRFGISDNYYSDAEQSVQGHIWMTQGRTTDILERVWLNSTGYGRSYVAPNLTLIRPDEGSAFDYFKAHGLSFDNFGEIVGSSESGGPRSGYPGFIFSLDTQDTERAAYLRRRWQAQCRLSTFTFAILPRDHTYGGSGGRPTPASMIAENDDALGDIVDAVSHSTWWPTTALFVVEDDPQDGGDHVDNHRSPLLVISPWAKRGAISHVNTHEASIYRTIQLILGIDEPLNDFWQNAAPLYDLFTSTPDYTPYEHVARVWPNENNPSASTSALMWDAVDFSEPDEQPGLSEWLWGHFHPTTPAPPRAR